MTTTTEALARQTALFIPLKTEYFEAFERGDKDTEYRPYGLRWNERTCCIGRRVVLSKGYGKRHRLTGIVVGFQVVGPDAHHAIRSVYPTGEKFAAIKISAALTPKDTTQEAPSHE